MHKHNDIDMESTRGHTFFMYHDLDERLNLLSEYLQQGIANGELCVLVTMESIEGAIKGFQSVGFDASIAVHEGSLRIFEMNPTYLPDGRFVASYMLKNVRKFIKDAKAQGYSGLRTAGEMSWLGEHPEAVEDAIAYEHSINTLNVPKPSFMGLCLYPVHDAFTKVLEGAVQTHPSVIHNHQARVNPLYQPA